MNEWKETEGRGTMWFDGLFIFSKNTTKKNEEKLIKIAQFQMVPFSWCLLAFSIKETYLHTYCNIQHPYGTIERSA